MSSLPTCPACNYKRQPTDCAPDWACPQCNKAYVKINSVRTGYCKNHFSEIASWRCDNCGKEFCRTCVQPIQPKPTIYKPIPTAVCPECKGLCVDFQYAMELAEAQRASDKYHNGQFLVAVIVATLIILSFPLQYFWGKSEGATDARRELPNLTWHEMDLYGPQVEPPEKSLRVVSHEFRGRSNRLKRMYIQGYVAGHNEVVLERLAKAKTHKQ